MCRRARGLPNLFSRAISHVFFTHDRRPALGRHPAAAVDISITLGEQLRSKLDRAAFPARGFTSPKVRHLLNNLGSLDGLDYLEVGVHRGATFVAANYQNTLASATASSGRR